MCKFFGPKIRSCKFFDKSQVCLAIVITFCLPTPLSTHKAQIKYCFGLDRGFWTKCNIPWSTLELSRGLEAWSHGNPTLLLSYIIYLNILKLADTIRFCFQQRRCIPEGEVVEKYFFHFHAIVHLCSVPRPFVNLSHLFLDWIGPMHSASAYFSSIFPSTFCHGKHTGWNVMQKCSILLLT